MAVVMAILAREERYAARSAYRILTDRVVKSDSRRGQPVESRRLDIGMPLMTETLCVVLVGQYK